MIAKSIPSTLTVTRKSDGCTLRATIWGRCNHFYEALSETCPASEDIEVEHIDSAEIEIDREPCEYVFLPLDNEQAIVEFLKLWGVDAYEEQWELDDD